jgi:hypothetical protein
MRASSMSSQGVVTAQLQGAHGFSLRNALALQRLGVVVDVARDPGAGRGIDVHESG